VHSNLSGFQFINGQLTNGFGKGYKCWIEMLLQGKRLFALAGNDAHGNFNRFRQVGIPFFKIKESEHQLFGRMRTGVFLETLSEKGILDSIRSGRTIVTDGPVANLIVDSSEQKSSSLGQIFIGKQHSILLEARSSTEFGSIESLKVFRGYIGQKEDILISETPGLCYDIKRNFTYEIEKDSYLRAEVWTSSADSYDGQSHFCLTNPIWFKPN